VTRAIRASDAHKKLKGTWELADHGRREAERRALTSAEKIADALRSIERDVESNGGLYPLNGGRITQQEVLRRANLSPAFLEKSHNKELKTLVTQWLARVNSQMLRGVKTIRRAITDRVTEAHDELNMIRQAWTEAELEYIHGQQMIAEANAAITILHQTNASLEKEVTNLKAQLAGNIVGPLNRSDR
jgi:hypothetical protein